MSVSPSHPPSPASADGRVLRIGVEVVSESRAPVVQWLLKRNCSTTPRQVLQWYASMCLLGLLIASFFWWQGAALVAPFAGLELLAVGAALLVHARHATDQERIVLQADRLTVEQVEAGRIARAEFFPGWVQIKPAASGRRLVEVSASGRRVAIGRHLRPDQRRLFVDELRWALRRLTWAIDPLGTAKAPVLFRELKQQP